MKLLKDIMDGSAKLLEQNISEVLGSTSRHYRQLAALGIKTVGDLLYYFPRTYEDQSFFTAVSNLRLNEKMVFKGKISNFVKRYSRSGKLLISAVFSDETGLLEVIWFSQPHILQLLRDGDEVVLSGKVVENFGRRVLSSPTYEKVSETLIHSARIVPIYPESPPVTSKWLREKIYKCRPYFPCFNEYLAGEILQRQGLISYKEAMYAVHFPQNSEILEKARERLAFDELFMIQLLALKKRWHFIQDYKEKHYQIDVSEEIFNRFLKQVPFELTAGQKRVIEEIFEDLKKPYPMLRLLQGDVGSGKTIVAAAGLFGTIQNGFQGVLMAPTEILAKQHFNSLEGLLKELGVRTELLVGSMSGKEKFKIAADIQNGSIHLMVGTHALIQEYVKFKNLGLAVIDEQHRFGVKQRDQLKEQGSPNLLHMTATPIPRSLALTLYGDQDFSILDEMPKGRKKIVTRIVPENKRHDAYKWIEEQVKNGRQVYVICPLIEESDVLEIKSVLSEYQRLKELIFPSLRIGLLHGKLSAEEKEAVMNQFNANKISILVSTSVIEVGIDVANATIIMIEGAERFGLAQLHQFRGRVGRGDEQSYCFLFPSKSNESVMKRLLALEKYNCGFQLAEIDLNERGPGEIYGLKQSGMPDLKMASLSDINLIKRARNEAIEIMKVDPELKRHNSLCEKVISYQKQYEIVFW